MKRFSLGLAVVAVWPLSAAADDLRSIRYFAEGPEAEVRVTGAGTDTATPFAIASVGKTFTAVAVLRLAEAGALGLDDPAADWLPVGVSEGLGGLDDVTLRHLLTMTSGLPDYYVDDYIEEALVDPEGVQRPEVAVGYAFDEGPLFRPGAEFDYSNTNYVLLGMILERATGATYAEVLDRQIFGPAGMTDSFVFGSRPLPAEFGPGHEDGTHVRSYYQGQGFGDGGVIASARDLWRFYDALFVRGVLLGRGGLVALQTDPLGAGYGMGIEVEEGILGHSGGDLGYSSDVRFDPATGAFAVILIAEGDADTDWAVDRLNPP